MTKLLLLLSLGTTVPAAAQRIRVTAPELGLRHQTGTLLSFDDHSLVFADESQRWVVPRQLLTQLQASRGQRGHTVLGLATGAVVGGIVGAILFTPTTSACEGSGNYEQNCRLYRAGIVVGSAGLGALVGSLIRSEKWGPVNPDSLGLDARR
jgi:hypothetical protein